MKELVCHSVEAFGTILIRADRNEKPFQCSFCDMYFARKDIVKKHIGRCHKEAADSFAVVMSCPTTQLAFNTNQVPHFQSTRTLAQEALDRPSVSPRTPSWMDMVNTPWNEDLGSPDVTRVAQTKLSDLNSTWDRMLPASGTENLSFAEDPSPTSRLIDCQPAGTITAAQTNAVSERQLEYSTVGSFSISQFKLAALRDEWRKVIRLQDLQYGMNG